MQTSNDSLKACFGNVNIRMCTLIRSNINELICVFQGGFFAEDEDLETRSYFPPSDNPFRDTGKEVSLL